MAEKMDVDELIRKEREQLMAQANKGTGDALMRGAGLATRAIGPIMAGGAAGAAMGAPIAGVGAVPGFLAGATAAALAAPISDIAVSGYRAAKDYLMPQQRTLSDLITSQQQAPQQQAPLPSQAFENLMTQAGLPEPETASERLASTALRIGAETMTGARTARMVADALPRTSQVARPVMQTLADQPGAQTAAATIAGTTTQGAIEAGAPPAVALPLGIAAGVVPSLRPGNLLPNTGGPMRAENVAALEAAGIPVTPGQRTGNPFGQVVESVMRYLPTSAPTAARVEDQQMRAWTKNILGQAGINSDVATPEVLTKARQGFRTEYNNLEKTTKLQGDQQLFNDLAGIENTYVRGFNDVAPAWERMRDTVLNYATGKAGDGTDYHRLQSRISEELARAKRSDTPSAGYWSEALQGLQKSLADAMERSAPSPDLRNAWADVNRRYMVFSRIEDTMARAGNDKLNTGFIPPQQLAAVERGRNPRQWVEGGDQLTDIARAGAAVLPDPVPNSGTAQRTFVQDLLTGGKRGAPMAAAGAGAQAAGIAAIDPVISLGLPYFVARQWHAPNLTPEMRRLLGAQAVMGASKAER